LINQIKERQGAAVTTATTLKAAPFIQIIGSINPTAPENVIPTLKELVKDVLSLYLDISTTVYYNDWDRIPEALKGLGKIKNCAQAQEMIKWKEIELNEYSSKESEIFFKDLQTKMESGC
jgi:hypothetical protein